MVVSGQDFATHIAPKTRVPKNAGHVLRRQRLIDLLHRNLDSRVQTVCAPAGYGKTALLADFCGELDIPVCWYSMDSSDSDLDWFVRGVVASIRSQFSGFGVATQARLAAAERNTNAAAQFADALAHDMRRDVHDYFLVVLEDYHFAQGSDVDKLVNRLLAQVPEGCHVIISSRNSVNIPVIATLRVRGQAASLVTSDLAFSTSDIKELLAHQGGPVLSEEEIGRLVGDSEGWIVGLLLQTQRMRPGERREAPPGPSRADVFSYLASEVYEGLPGELQSFLLKSSVLEQIDPELCDRLLGIRKSQKLLKEIEKRNLFLSSVPTQRPCYRYHPLFRDFLQDRLGDISPDDFRRLHAKAGSIFKQEQRWQEAFEHFVSARYYSQARDILKKAGQELLDAGKWTTVSRLVEALPARYRLLDGELLLLQAQTEIHAGRVDEAARALTKVIDSTTGTNEWIRLAKALSWRSAAHRLAGNLAAALVDIKASISLLEQNHGPGDSLGEGYRRLGIIMHERGYLVSAVRQLKRALNHFSSVFAVEQTAAVHNSLGIVYREVGDMAKAGSHLDLARQGWQRTGNNGALASVLNNLGLVYQCQGDYDLALKTFRAGLQNARESGYRRMEACLLISMADLLRDVGLYGEALSLYEEGKKTAEEVMEVYYVACATAGMGEIRRLLGDNDRAEILLKQAISLAEEHGRSYEAAVFSIRLGVVECQRGEYNKALSILGLASSRIQKIGDKDALARTYFHVAQAHFLSKNYADAKRALLEASRLADQLGYDAFFAVEGRNGALLLQYAASEGVGAGRFVRALQAVEHQDSEKAAAPLQLAVGPVERPRQNIQVYAFGQGRVVINGHNVGDSEWRSARAAEMFFYLLCSERAKTREQIAADLWPDLSPAKSTSNFHISLYRARHALLPGIVTLQDGRYRVPRDIGIWFDVDEFSQAVDQVNHLSADTKSLMAPFRKAVELYKGPFLPEIYSEWAEDRRRELQGKYIKALRVLARWYCERSELQEALAILEKIATLDPFDDELVTEIEGWTTRTSAALLLKEYRRYLSSMGHGDPDARPQRTTATSPRYLAPPPH